MRITTTIPAAPKPENPVFIDKVIAQVQDSLISELSWLDHAFGQSQRLVKRKGSKEYQYPAAHVGKGKYESLLPDNRFQNFSFFIIEDPQTVEFNPNSFNDVKVDYSLVFWLKLDSIFSESEDRDKEAVKVEILRVLTRKLRLTSGRLSVTEIYENAENLYREYSIREVNSQFLMQPYVGFRFTGELTLVEPCI